MLQSCRWGPSTLLVLLQVLMYVLQDVKDKAKAFIKRKMEQLTQEHAAALLSSEQQISALASARNFAERERDELAEQRNQLRQELEVMRAAQPTDASSDLQQRVAEDLARVQSEVETLRAQLVISQRHYAESVDAAAAADAFRQKQLEAEKARCFEELQAERKRAEAALSDARAQFSAALLNSQTAAGSVAAADESAKILAERNAALERESRELLQVTAAAERAFKSFVIFVYTIIIFWHCIGFNILGAGASGKRCHAFALC
jgi:hypothetical protein